MYLVTGGAGFIGSNMVHHLLGKGEKVRVLDNLATGRKVNLEDVLDRIEYVEGDLRNPPDLEKAVDGVRYVLAFGALPSVIRSVEDPATSHDSNVNAIFNLLMACRSAGVERLVFSSSSSVYGDTPVLPKREDMLPNPLSPYALSKLTGEHYCRIFYELYGIKTFSLRYFNVFGPRQDPTSHYAAVIPLFIKALLKDTAPTIHGSGEQTRDFTYVDDIVAANLACCTADDKAAGGVYNAAWGNRISINELAASIAKLLGKDIKPVHGPARPGEVMDSQADASRAKELLGWTPKVTFEEGLSRTIEWFRAGH